MHNFVSKNLRFTFYVSCLTAFDQITKLIFSNRDFFLGPLHVHTLRNYGLSFSLNFGVTLNIFLVAIGLLFFGYYFFRYRHEFSNFQRWAFILIFAGAISNVVDRVSLGYVVDFLDLGLGFTFNFADVYVLLGLAMLLSPSGDKIPN